MNKIIVNKQRNMTLLFFVIVWFMVACQANQSTQPEPAILVSTPTNSDTEIPIETIATKLTPSVSPTELATSVPPTPSVTPYATQTIRPTETLIPTIIPTPVPWSGQLAFASQRHDTNGDGVIDDNDGVHIYSLKAETEQLTQLTSGEHRDIHPSWSPGGDQIAFISNRTGNFELFTMNADGSGLEQLTNTPENETTPSWSPDGTKIAYVLVKNLDSGEQERSLHLISPEGITDQKPLFEQGDIYRPDWSPDGRYLTFERSDIIVNEGKTSRETNFYFWDTLTSSLTKLNLAGSQFQNIYLRDPKWLPRSGYFLSFDVEMRLSDTPSRLAKVYEVVWEDNEPTLKETLIINNVYAPYVWGPNGEWFISFDSNNVDSGINLERLSIDYSKRPPVSAMDDLREFIIDNVYYYSEPDWTP